MEEGHPAHDALLKIFLKKIKRSKKKDAGEGKLACISFLLISFLLMQLIVAHRCSWPAAHDSSLE